LYTGITCRKSDVALQRRHTARGSTVVDEAEGWPRAFGFGAAGALPPLLR
jgi:hypothetical protein